MPRLRFGARPTAPLHEPLDERQRLVVAGSAIGLLAAVVSGHSLAAAFAAGGVVAVAVLGR